MIELLRDLRFRVDDTREQLLRSRMNGDSLYGLDEWSGPIVNLQKVVDILDKVVDILDKELMKE